MDKKVRVRFAPSPTGPLHIGGVRTALYNYLFARQHGGDLIFRIEDTDSTRFVPGAEEYIIESFKWLGIQFDEGVSFGGDHGPYRQSERRDIYKKYVQVLLDNGKAYIAFDTPEELAGAFHTSLELGFGSGMLVTNPIPEEYSMDPAVINKAIDEAIEQAKANGIHGKATTPFLLAKVKELTGGDSLDSNIQLVFNNARLAARTAAALEKLK